MRKGRRVLVAEEGVTEINMDDCVWGEFMGEECVF